MTFGIIYFAKKFIQVNVCRLYCRHMSGTEVDTIFSLSSAHGKCGVSIIRVSGPRAEAALQAFAGKKKPIKKRVATLRELQHPLSKDLIDKGLILWFPGPTSFTGEDCCEFQVHGSIAVIEAMLNGLGSISGLRLAKPGEFTKRAFFNGKLDLTEIEGLADLIHAETEAQRKQAVLQSTGSLSRLYSSWRLSLIRCVAHIEALIDFSEEENIEDGVIEALQEEIKRIQIEIEAHINDQRQGEMLRHGVRTAIIGAPNVGKSSFINLVCQRNVSIVTPVAGTTRDVIQSAYNIGGYPILISDTAGLRTTINDPIEQEGIARAKNCLENADFVLLLLDVKKLLQEKVDSETKLEEFMKKYLEELDISVNALYGKHIQLIANKIDLICAEDVKNLKKISNLILISCKEERNFSNCLLNISTKLKEICGQPTPENPRLTQSRYREELTKCQKYLNTFLSYYNTDKNPDMAISAEKLRQAVKSIEYITGTINTDEILDVIFRDFCIGK